MPGRPTIWITVGQGPTALSVGAGGGCMDIFILVYPFLSSFSLPLGETARYRLKYCLKGPLNPNQPTNQPKRNTSVRTPDPKQRGKEKSVQNTDRQPKGSDNPIRQHNRFSTLEDMEAEESPSCIPKGTLNRIPTS